MKTFQDYKDECKRLEAENYKLASKCNDFNNKVNALNLKLDYYKKALKRLLEI